MTLQEKIDESGKSDTYLACALGISRQAFYDKLNGKYEWNADEITILMKELKLTYKQTVQMFIEH